jgi:hypothetical protein
MTTHSRYSDFMAAGLLAPDGSPWTFWHIPSRKIAASMLCAGASDQYVLYGVRGCTFAGIQDGFPYFNVPGNGVQGLTLEQAKACHIHRLPQSADVRKFRSKV